MPRPSVVRRTYKTRITITSVQRQRNGVSGQPFWDVRFDEEATYDTTTRNPMLAVVFDEPLYCAVMRLDAPEEHFRGDAYEEILRRVAERYESAREALLDGSPTARVRRRDPVGKTFVF